MAAMQEVEVENEVLERKEEESLLFSSGLQHADSKMQVL